MYDFIEGITMIETTNEEMVNVEMSISYYAAFLEKFPEHIKNIKDENLLIKLIKIKPSLFNYVENQTEAVCIAVVLQDISYLFNVENQTEDLCLAAVRKNGWALEYVEDQTETICLEAVKNNPWALQFVENQTPEICLEAVKQDGGVLLFVNRQTEEICLEAVKQDPEAIGLILDKEMFYKVAEALNIKVA